MTAGQRQRRDTACAVATALALAALPFASTSARAAPAEARPYHATGTPVKGSVNGCADAPLVEPGRYVDSLVGDRDLFYKVRKRADQQLQVSVTAIAGRDYTRNANFAVLAGDPGSGEPRGWLRAAGHSVGWSTVITGGARSAPGAGAGLRLPDDVGCVMVDNRVNEPWEDPVPVELRIGIADDTTRRSGEQAPAPVTGAAVQGGLSFDDATPIGAGTYRQSLVVGESPFWRVDLKAGQQLTVTAGVEIPVGFPQNTETGWTVHIYNATRTEAACDEDDPSVTLLLSNRTGRFERMCGPWTVTRPQDSADPVDTDGYATPGTYYVQLDVAEPNAAMKGIPVPIDLTVGISGTPLPGDDPVFVFGPVVPSTAPPAPATSTPPDASPGTPTTPGASAGDTQQPRPPAPTAHPDDPSDTASPQGGESTLEQLALPVGIALAVTLIGATAYYGLRRGRPN